MAEGVSIVLGGCGFIGSHVCGELKRRGRYVIAVDQKPCPYTFDTTPDETLLCDLRVRDHCMFAFQKANNVLDDLKGKTPDDLPQPQLWVYHFAADMGGMGYIHDNSSVIIENNTLITSNIIQSCKQFHAARLLYASSACVYPVDKQQVTDFALKEDMAWPAQPQDGYGLEKLFGEEAIKYAMKESGGALSVRIARFHNVYGPRGTWIGGREKAPAAMLRKALATRILINNGEVNTKIEIWGDGTAVRSYLYIDDAVDGICNLMNSSVVEPLNIGSSEAVTVLELARYCADLADVPGDDARFVNNYYGPKGVNARSSDNTQVMAALNWSPKVDLKQGLGKTLEWMKTEVFNNLSTSLGPEGPWNDFLRSCLLSAYGKQVMGHHLQLGPESRSNELRRFGLLLPVTSAKDGVAVRENVRTFLKSLAHTTKTENAWCFDIFFGVDEGDPVCDPRKGEDLSRLVAATMPLEWALGKVTANTRLFSYPKGSICKIWADLAMDAFRAGCDLMVLLGDDVTLLTDGWPSKIWEGFADMHRTTMLPFGFGCVAFEDTSFPGFPTFPVVHKLHMSVCGGRIFPDAFVNQDADPFLFQTYRAFNASVLLSNVQLRNAVGGAGTARYRKVCAADWRDSLLTTSRAEAASWLHFNHATPKRFLPTITLDVVVPTFRANKEVLNAILQLKVPEGVSTQLTIILDRPGDPKTEQVLKELTEEHKGNPFVRIRCNQQNIGASGSRNNGLKESCADWVLFLDDDVQPNPDILRQYAHAIREHPNATGFIGASILPDATTARQAGVHIAGVSFFWTAASVFPTATELPWGVTANICVRRLPRLEFDTSGAFPKTGGGEDIDFCLRARDQWRQLCPTGKGFVAAPSALIRHPWWDGGSPKYSHFSGWSRGDGYLIDLYPQLTYLNLPNFAETTFVGLLVVIGCLLLAMYGRFFGGGGNHEVCTSLCALTVGLLFSFIAADYAFEWRDRGGSAAQEKIRALSASSMALAIAHGISIRYWSEIGRLLGHLTRGRLHLLRRFNWFGDFWPGAVHVERKREALRWVWRLTLFAVLLAACVRHPPSRAAAL